MMATYKDFEKINIGDSDIDSLVLRTYESVALLKFYSVGGYRAYECFGDDVEIDKHYKKVFSGESWLQIYDDYGQSYMAHLPQDYMKFDVYRAGDYECIIHWHN